MELVLNYIIDNIFRNTPVLMGLIVAFGLILNKKQWDEVLKGEPDDIDAGMNNMDAWIENGKNNQDYTWKVVRI